MKSTKATSGTAALYAHYKEALTATARGTVGCAGKASGRSPGPEVSLLVPRRLEARPSRSWLPSSRLRQRWLSCPAARGILVESCLDRLQKRPGLVFRRALDAPNDAAICRDDDAKGPVGVRCM
eukprot:scaffold1397_cov254-Pinguiococcus_pyrenoidosus.AAC.15